MWNEELGSWNSYPPSGFPIPHFARGRSEGDADVGQPDVRHELRGVVAVGAASEQPRHPEPDTHTHVPIRTEQPGVADLQSDAGQHAVITKTVAPEAIRAGPGAKIE